MTSWPEVRCTRLQHNSVRLRFSADDITRLEVHHAINLWVADGTPRPGFVAQTLPWEDLYDPQLAEHHRQAQVQRGGHCPSHLPAPSGDGPQPHPTQRRERAPAQVDDGAPAATVIDLAAENDARDKPTGQLAFEGDRDVDELE